ncbi:MAG TPA: hypothetical protein VHK26_10485 [Methyloceanibacter sp.]|jgi:hypothetical protein|nr:hypothetical protein [Methyloceanibacter sp.]
MTFEEARGRLISALHLTANVLDCKTVAGKLGNDDVALSELELHSLVAMELCLELETSKTPSSIFRASIRSATAPRPRRSSSVFTARAIRPT